MAVFVALIFQVLFVFFAMAINVGLVVHDKINLQNSVDLAAYYAAQRQAEWLNVIAHQNYQIRQSFKLMTWRYRVLGTMGLVETNPPHPAYRPNQVSDRPYAEAVTPMACASYRPVWQDIAEGEDSLCKQKNLNIPQITVAPVIAAFNPINAIYAQFARRMQERINETCNSYGGYNYLYVNLIKFLYRQDQFRLKQSILAIAENLARPAQQMLDLNGATVYQGANKTFLKNLTYENTASITDPNNAITIYNSIEGRRPDEWLNEIKVNLTMYYRDVDTSSGCRGLNKLAFQTPQRNEGLALIQRILGITAEESQNLLAADPPAGSLARMSLGFEKNPWMRLYVGVKGVTRPRQLFFPFGDPVQFEAKAYASPFGGRIGPWYKERWPQGAPASDGREIDSLLPPLVAGESNQVDPEQADRLLPNYSRYLGDRLGLSSELAQAALIGQASMTGRLGSLAGAFDSQQGSSPDILTWEGTPNSSMRRFEIAAVSPDIFDSIFYSIEPNFGRTYLPKLRALAGALQIPDNAFPRGDLGSHDGSSELAGFSVKDQMALAGAQLGGGGFLNSGQSIHRPDAFWFLRDRAHLLTSWVHNDVVADFSEFPEARYGKCEEWDDEYKTKIPGSCLYSGGRTGYSVKIISGNFLRADGVQYGGKDQRGALLNPPPDDW